MMTAQDTTNIWNYMKHQTLKNFELTNAVQIQNMRKESQRIENLLPQEFRSDWQKINSYEMTPPDLVVPRDALNMKNYGF